MTPGSSSPAAGAAEPAPRPAPPVEERPSRIEPSGPPVEVVTGTGYTNETYGFRIFKPPTWRSYPQLIRPRTPLVAALGTPDESTLLLIGRESCNGTLDDYARGAERLLQQFYEDYRPQGEHPSEVAGLRAIERSFTARDGDHFWTGMAVYIARGRYCYTLLGLTTAGETVPFQQAVLHRVAKSLEFAGVRLCLPQLSSRAGPDAVRMTARELVLGDFGEVEVGDAHGGYDHLEGLLAGGAHCRAQQLHLIEHFLQALVEAQVADGVLHLAAFDQVDPIARHPVRIFA
jgi:hypothetical protein